MRIHLNKIGIVNNSSISIDGLTVITGKNNSGKTTVGKALYSLLDSVSNLSAKAINDRNQYIISVLDDVVETMDFFRFFARSFEFDDKEFKESPLYSYRAIVFLFSKEYRHEMPQSELLKFANDVRDELLSLDPLALSQYKYIQQYSHHVIRADSKNRIESIISEQISKAVTILDNLFSSLEKDPQLLEYTREAINQTLLTEFSGQIQPASFDVENSSIEIFEGDTCSFK